MFEKKTDSELLALLRTLFALERNYLAEERTYLAKFRTGLALALFAPSMYIYSVALNWDLNLFFLIFFYCFLIICILEGFRQMIYSRLNLKKCRTLKNLVLESENEIIKSSENISNLFSNFINFPIENKNKFIYEMTSIGMKKNEVK